MIPLTDQIEREVTHFLLKAAELLDDRRYEEWLGLLTEDIRYTVPVRVTHEGGSEFAEGMAHFEEDYRSLEMRVRRLRSSRAWAESPPSRTRHFISNIRVEPGDREDELKVRSNVLLYRGRGDDPQYDLLSAECWDVVRRVNGQWKLARRTVLLDHTALKTHNLSVLF
jgi:3-phenylpropionate/cinnamic acid dioxygenase small subunit